MLYICIRTLKAGCFIYKLCLCHVTYFTYISVSTFFNMSNENVFLTIQIIFSKWCLTLRIQISIAFCKHKPLLYVQNGFVIHKITEYITYSHVCYGHKWCTVHCNFYNKSQAFSDMFFLIECFIIFQKLAEKLWLIFFVCRLIFRGYLMSSVITSCCVKHCASTTFLCNCNNRNVVYTPEYCSRSWSSPHRNLQWHLNQAIMLQH